MDDTPSIGIDFGTTNSSMAWFNPRTNQAEVILNAEGEAKTPSLVYFGEEETLVGKQVDELIEDVSNDRARRDEVFKRTVVSIQRNLVNPPRIALPGGRFVRPVDVAAEILKKLKRDAEEGHFHEEIQRAVVTCPAEFNAIQRKKIEDACCLAGFGEFVLVEEPVAGALSYARAGLNVGRHVLVYDLGGGTFDLAVLENEGESFQVAMEPKGMDRCGGDDFDLALYYHCEELAHANLNRSISLTGNVDLKFLRMCRRRKENLSYQEKSRFSSYLASENGPAHFEHEVDRGTFEELIDPYIEETSSLTETILEQAAARGHEVDTAVLIGGSSRVPLVGRTVFDALPVALLKFDKKDVAVALGAAYYANILWAPRPGVATPPAPPPAPTLSDEYREAIKAVASGRIDGKQSDRLDALADQLDLSEEQRVEIERQVLGATVEEILARQREEYREAVEGARKDRRLNRAALEQFDALARELGVEDEAAEIERGVLGASREDLPERYREAVMAARNQLNDTADALGLSREWTAEIEREVSGETGRLAREEHDAGLSEVEVVGERDAERRDEEPEEVLPARFTLARTLTEHSEYVRSVAVSPDGQLLASGGADYAIHLWDTNTGELLRTLTGHTSVVGSVAFSPDGYLLASGGGGVTRLWDTRTGELLYTLQEGHGGLVRSLAFRLDGRLFASCCGMDINIRDLQTRELLHSFAGRMTFWGFNEGGQSLAMSPDGKLLASGSSDKSIKLWNVETGKLIRKITGHAGAVNSVVISSDGRILASGSEDTTIKIWNSKTLSLLQSLNVDSQVLSVVVSPDDRLLFSGDADGKIKVWNPKTGELLDTLSGHSKRVNSVAASPDGRLVSGGADTTVRIWERKEQG